MKLLRFPTALTPPVLRRLGPADVVILCLVAGAVATVVAFAREFEAPFLQAVRIDLRPAALPRYTLYSLTRGVLALAISYLFALGFGWAAARSRAAERLLLPLLDILQSIPVLGFLPGLVLGLVSLFPTRNVGLYGACAGVLYGLSASLCKPTVEILGDDGLGAVLTSWEAYAFAIAGILAFVVQQVSLATGKLAASVAAVAGAWRR